MERRSEVARSATSRTQEDQQGKRDGGFRADGPATTTEASFPRLNVGTTELTHDYNVHARDNGIPEHTEHLLLFGGWSLDTAGIYIFFRGPVPKRAIDLGTTRTFVSSRRSRWGNFNTDKEVGSPQMQRWPQEEFDAFR